MLGQSRTTEASMTEAKAGVREMSSTVQDGDCTMEDFKQGSGTMSGEITGDKLPGGKANMEMNLTSERIGDCKS